MFSQVAFQLALVAAVALLSLVPLLRRALSARSRVVRVACVPLWIATATALTAKAFEYAAPRALERSTPVTNRPVEVASGGYVSSRQCVACHEDEYSSWHASFHRRMTQVLTPETAQSDIDGTVLERDGKTWRLFREGDAFFVEMDEPEWQAERRAGKRPRVVRPLVLSTGSHHYEALWFSDETTRKVSMLPFCWRVDQQRWLPVDAAFLVPPDMEQGAEGRWNLACNKCHATHPRSRIAGRFDMQTEVAEFGIACESCHGPGEAHAKSNRDPAVRYASYLGDASAASITNPARLDPVRASMVCGQCHAAVELKSAADQREWNEHGPSYRPGDELEEDRRLRATGAEKFWDDGMIRTSGREYNGLVRSPCYAHGDSTRPVMSCMSCHRMHTRADDPRALSEWAVDQLGPEMDGDRACTQCHARFEGLDGRAAIAEHTRHSPEGEGSRCMNCHMPYTTYGLLKSIRSHTISSPTIAESLEVGRPNACNLCHLDRTLAWAGEKLADWYGQPGPHSARGNRGLTPDEKEVAAGVLWAVRGDAGQRALVTCAMERPEVRAVSGEEWFAPLLGQLLQDPYHAVRVLAERSLRALPGYSDVDYDFMAAPEARARATRSVREIWERTRSFEPRPLRSGVLLDDAGQFDDAALERLLKQRDDRRVTLSE